MIMIDAAKYSGSAATKVQIFLGEAICQIAKEIFSPLNRYGAQCAFATHEPTIDQLVDNYVKTGAMCRCIERFSRRVQT
jgi:hypothetical protein